MSGVRGWDRDPDLLAANTILINAGSALASLLRLDSRYELVHEDRVAAVFIARGVDDGGRPGDAGPKGDGQTMGNAAAEGRGHDARGRGGDP